MIIGYYFSKVKLIIMTIIFLIFVILYAQVGPLIQIYFIK